MILLVDLDGTLIDVADRHYQVYRASLRQLGGTPLEQRRYWALKRANTPWRDMLRESGFEEDVAGQFLEGFVDLIERPDYLRLDRLIPGAMAALESLASVGECFVVTLRRDEQSLAAQIAQLGIAAHVHGVLSGGSGAEGSSSKVELIRPVLAGHTTGVVIGDTEADVKAGQALGLLTIGVRSGMRSGSVLAALSPDHLVSDIGSVPGIIRSLPEG